MRSLASNKGTFKVNDGTNSNGRGSAMTTSATSRIDEQCSLKLKAPIGLEDSSSTGANGSIISNGRSNNKATSSVEKKAGQVNFTPLRVQSWRDIDATTKKKLFELTLERFQVEGHKNSVLLQIHRSYNNWRDSLKKKWFYKYGTIEEAFDNIPKEITKQDAEYLAKLWNSTEYKEICARNQRNRSKLNVYHICGSQSIQQMADKEAHTTNVEPSRIRIWELTHTRSDGSTVNEATKEKMIPRLPIVAEAADRQNSINVLLK